MITELESPYQSPDYPVDLRFSERAADAADTYNGEVVRRDDIEIFVINNGEIRIEGNCGKYSVGAGQCLIIGPSVSHEIYSSRKENTAYYRLVFSPTFVLGPEKNGILYEKYVVPTYEESKHGVIILDEANLKDEQALNVINEIIVANMVKKSGYELVTKAHLCNLWMMVYERMLEEKSDYNGRNVPSRDEIRVKSAISFIESNYSDYITLETVADHIHVSRNECCRCFKRVLGVSPMEFIILRRIYEAARILYKNPLKVNSISELAFVVGFNNTSYFNRQFKRIMGCTPSEFSLMIKNDSSRAAFIFDDLSQNVQGII